MEAKISPQQEIDDLLAKAYTVRVSNPDYSVALAEQAVDLSRQVSTDLYAKAMNQLGLFWMIKGEFQRATELSQKALSHFEEVNDLEGIADAKYNIGSVYYKTNNFHLGLQYLLDCLQLYRTLRDKHNEARVLKAIGTIYEYFGDNENAIDSYRKCIDAAQAVNDLNQVSNAYNPLSGIYLKQGQYELALSIIEKSIHIKEKTGDIRGLAFALYGRGKVFLTGAKYNEAFRDLSRSLEIQKEMGDRLGEGMAYNKLGLLHMAQKNYPQAESCFLNAVHVAQQFNIQFILFKVHYNLYLLSREQQQTDRALQYLEKYIAMKEVVINSHTYNVIKSYDALSKIESLEREARAQKDKAEIIERKNSELDSFFYRISHDLKGPISSLLGLYNLVKLEIKDTTALRYFDLYQSQIQRINNIVMDLINLTRMNHTTGAKTIIDFKVLVQECILSYSYINNFGQIRFVQQIDEEVVFQSEWGVINTILQNLIENAIKYARTDTEPYVGIFVTRENDYLVIKVEDNGQGILLDHQSRIFDMFFRANDRTQGTGLGLYILKRAVERLNGEISLQSELNVGSSFIVRLPLPK